MLFSSNLSSVFTILSYLLSVVLYEMIKIEQNQIMSQLYHFTCLKQRSLQNWLLLIFTISWPNFTDQVWYFNFFIISLVCVCNAISHDLDARWRQKLYCYNDLQSYFSKQLSLIVRCTWQAAQIKKVTLYVSVQLWSKSCLCFWTFP